MGTTQLIHNLKPRHLLFVHGGSSEALRQLTELEELRSRYRIHLGEPGAEVALTTKQASKKPVFEQQRSPRAITPRRYGGELLEESSGICLQLDDDIALDPRWQALVETGLLELEWQGEDLLIRGISPQALMGRRDRKRAAIAIR